MKWFGLIAMAVVLISCGSSDQKEKLMPTLSNAEWQAVSIGGMNLKDVPMDERPTLKFNGEDYTVGGSTGCNNFNSNYKVAPEAGTLTFGMMTITKKACPDMKVEDAFTDALEKTTSFRIEGNNLQLMSASGVELLEATAFKLYGKKSEED